MKVPRLSGSARRSPTLQAGPQHQQGPTCINGLQRKPGRCKSGVHWRRGLGGAPRPRVTAINQQRGKWVAFPPQDEAGRAAGRLLGGVSTGRPGARREAKLFKGGRGGLSIESPPRCRPLPLHPSLHIRRQPPHPGYAPLRSHHFPFVSRHPSLPPSLPLLLPNTVYLSTFTVTAL